MKNRDLLKLAFEAGKEYGSNRTDKNFNDFLDKHKEQLASSEQLRSSCDWCNGNNSSKSDNVSNITDIG